jgi:hypothetical protein
MINLCCALLNGVSFKLSKFRWLSADAMRAGITAAFLDSPLSAFNPKVIVGVYSSGFAGETRGGCGCARPGKTEGW